ETDASALRPFYLEVLQNMLSFSTIETFRMASTQTPIGGSPFRTTIPVTSTTQSITFTVMWDARRGPLKATVNPPGGASPITKVDQSGRLIINEMLPISPAFSSAGDWQLQIESATGGRPVPFHLVVMGDDSAM